MPRLKLDPGHIKHRISYLKVTFTQSEHRMSHLKLDIDERKHQMPYFTLAFTQSKREMPRLKFTLMSAGPRISHPMAGIAGDMSRVWHWRRDIGGNRS